MSQNNCSFDKTNGTCIIKTCVPRYCIGTEETKKESGVLTRICKSNEKSFGNNDKCTCKYESGGPICELIELKSTKRHHFRQ